MPNDGRPDEIVERLSVSRFFEMLAEASARQPRREFSRNWSLNVKLRWG